MKERAAREISVDQLAAPPVQECTATIPVDPGRHPVRPASSGPGHRSNHAAIAAFAATFKHFGGLQSGQRLYSQTLHE